MVIEKKKSDLVCEFFYFKPCSTEPDSRMGSGSHLFNIFEGSDLGQDE